MLALHSTSEKCDLTTTVILYEEAGRDRYKCQQNEVFLIKIADLSPFTSHVTYEHIIHRDTILHLPLKLLQ